MSWHPKVVFCCSVVGKKTLKSANFCKFAKTSYFLVLSGKNSVEVKRNIQNWIFLNVSIWRIGSNLNPVPDVACCRLLHSYTLFLKSYVQFFLGYHGYLKVFSKEPSAQGGSTSPGWKALIKFLPIIKKIVAQHPGPVLPPRGDGSRLHVARQFSLKMWWCSALSLKMLNAQVASI